MRRQGPAERREETRDLRGSGHRQVRPRDRRGRRDGRGGRQAHEVQERRGRLERCVAWLESVAESEDDVFVGMEATGHY